ncbi:37S ribosomal protein-like protein Rsm22 [Pyrenochaeta sp. DS3sAY3a]|nr:37S ribosomal protein-like protein Rsm22 [Pyrenochaeta sp. DS3sAY3a]
MLRTRSVQSICASCRLNLAISQARNARLSSQAQRAPQLLRPTASNSLTARRALSTGFLQNLLGQKKEAASNELPPTPADNLNAEVNARKARQQFGDALPKGHLSKDEFTVYERLYGTPVFAEKAEDLLDAHNPVLEEVVEEELPDGSTILLRRGKDGQLEEVEMDDAIEEVDEHVDGEKEGQTMTAEDWELYKEQEASAYHEEIYEKSMAAQEEADVEAEEDTEDFMRAHPLTIQGRFKPSPSTIFLPKESLVDPTTVLLNRTNNKHLAESANRIFGGRGLPQSASTLPARLGKQQKPIPLDPSQSDMGHIEADVYMASVQPGTYASVMSILVEVRRRLGSQWLANLLSHKKGGTILDAGSGGVGVLAWHEILNAEWQRMHEGQGNHTGDATPLGKATVLTASDTLRHRMSKLLENTTFIPRLPEAVADNQVDDNTQQPRKLYDVIIAPHTLWPLRQEYIRKEQVDKYWSLLNPKGGVLILLEKGLPRGFEVLAAARSHLLDKHIASPGSDTLESSVDSQISNPDEETRFTHKETGMIIAPCTNHSSCPMYQNPGANQGRKDFCFFSQRYIRPPYLQRILDAQDKNYEDVQFSYIAVQRGRDQRLPEYDVLGKGFSQNEESTTAAFEGHEDKGLPATTGESSETSVESVNPLSFPRLILPALKRRGHVILDVCTPAGTLERWTVPRSFSKQAYRDARKSRWGDLWALGAKTRIPRNVRLGRPSDEFDKKGRKIKKAKKLTIELGIGEKDGKPVEEGEARVYGKGGRLMVGDRDGRYTTDRKIRGSGGRKGRRKQPGSVLDDM